MACASCAPGGEPRAQGSAFTLTEATFEKIWPESIGFPPQMPYLSRMIGRSDAFVLTGALTKVDVHRILGEDDNYVELSDSDPMADLLFGLLALLQRAASEEGAEQHRCACT